MTTEQIAKPEQWRTRRGEEKRRGGGALLDARELATALGENERTIRTWRNAGIIPSLCLGYRTYRYRLEDVMTAIAKRTV